jgi:hypothetical protein
MERKPLCPIMSSAAAAGADRLSSEALIPPRTIAQQKMSPCVRADAIDRVGNSGADVLNFDEFVMLPLRENYVRDVSGPQPIHDYYFFEPTPKRLMRVWRPGRDFSKAETGGHQIKGATVASESLVLRHYLFRNQQHAYEKYSTRIFDSSELAGGWHGDR